MTTEQIERIVKRLNFQTWYLKREQYKNGSYSRHGGDTTIEVLNSMVEELKQVLEERHEEELREKIKRELMENLVGVVIEQY